MAETLWYYEDSGRQAGPVSESALRELIRAGRLGPDARVWRSGMAGWQPWPSVAELRGGAAAGSAPAPAPRELELVDLPLLVILTIVTLGIYGLVAFYRAGDRYVRLAPSRQSNFETLFWLYVAAYVLEFTGWMIFGPLAALAVIAAFVVGILLLNEVLAQRAEVVRVHGLHVAPMSDTTHRVLWIVGQLTGWMGVGVILLIVQGFKFFDDHNQIVRALRASAPRPSGGEPFATTAAAPPASFGPPGAPAGEPFPAERACVRCGGPLSPADRFCSRCGTAAA